MEDYVKVLIVIHDFGSGGAQKSLVSFLRGLEKADLLAKYDIDILVSDNYGIFKKDVPAAVNIQLADSTITWMNCPLRNKRIWKNMSVKSLIGEIRWILWQKFNLGPKTQSGARKIWECWNKFVPKNMNVYDIAISYINGWANYYVMDKVIAKKKVLWIHNDYQMQPHDIDFDERYYDNCDQIVTISEECKNSFLKSFPALKNKINVLQNITIVEDVLDKAKNGQTPELELATEKLKIVSVGRLSQQKAFHIAIEAAAILKKIGLDFVWLILGEGEERHSLEAQIRNCELNNYVFLVGIKENPYVYIDRCDLFVQTSIYEGKSIVLDEAKILLKPIVVTNYPTIKDSITNMENGIITGIDGHSVADAIVRLASDNKLQAYFKRNLEIERTNSKSELDKYVHIMLEMEGGNK